MREKLNFAFVFLLLLGIILSANFVLGAGVLQNPASSTTVGGTSVLLNTTVMEGGNISLGFNCTYQVKSPSTSNSSFSQIAFQITNSTTNSSYTWVNLTNVIEDSTDYTFNSTCKNSTAVIEDLTTTSVTIDSSIPQAPVSLSPVNNFDWTNTSGIAFSSTVVGFNTTGCTLYLTGIGGGASTSYAMTHSSNTCTYALTTDTDDSADNGLYYYTIEASDGTNKTNSVQNKFTVSIPSSSGGLANQQQVAQFKKQQALALGVKNSGDNSPLGIVIIALILIVTIYFISQRK